MQYTGLGDEDVAVVFPGISTYASSNDVLSSNDGLISMLLDGKNGEVSF